MYKSHRYWKCISLITNCEHAFNIRSLSYLNKSDHYCTLVQCVYVTTNFTEQNRNSGFKIIYIYLISAQGSTGTGREEASIHVSWTATEVQW